MFQNVALFAWQCMTMCHEREREWAVKCVCVCACTYVCVGTCALAWMSVCTGAKCYSCPAPEHKKLMSCKLIFIAAQCVWVCVCACMCVFAHVHLHECQSVQGEMLQLLCPRALEAHVMWIHLWRSPAYDFTYMGHLKKKCRNRCSQFLQSFSNKIFNLFV